MSKIDEAIKYLEYIRDCLMALQEIQRAGSCNDCADKKTCQYVPMPGLQVRRNCPFYVRAMWRGDNETK